MRPSRRRYVAFCQQVLALGVVVVALVPASGVVSLDVVGVAPTQPATSSPHTSRAPASPSPAQVRDHADRMRAYAVETTRGSEVPVAPVDPVVHEVPLTPAPTRASAPAERAGTPAKRVAPKRAEVTSAPQPVTGLGTVGVTWETGEVVPDDAITLQVRTQDGGAWSEWSDLTYHDDHGPDADSEEGKKARPGTDGTVVGDVDQVQVRVEMDEGAELPDDLKLAVVDPGAAVATDEEAPAIDTADLQAPPSAADPTYSQPPVEETPAGDPAEDPAVAALRATTVTPKPKIYSRAQWGADESMRDKSSLSYFEVHGGFVHHTVNANNYKRRDVPAIIRSIYAYHVRSRGWSDIGYNFLVDRFGRIWEGRYGGVDRPVVGAHTLNYNSYSFAMSAIGNYDIAQPPQAMIQAYGALMAWKLSLHGVSAGSTIQRIGTKNFQAINGHRDAAATACPGRYLYAKLPEIRALAAAAQADWSGRDLQSDLVGGPAPDLVARRISDGQAVILPIRTPASGAVLGTPVDTGLSLTRANAVLSVGDWDRDGINDLVTRSNRGALRVRRGDGAGHFSGPSILLGKGYGNVTMLAAVGDMTGDGYPDLMGQPTGSGMRIYPGAGTAGLAPSYPAYSQVNGTQLVGIGRWNSDGAPDVMVRNGSTLTAWAGNGPGDLTGALPGSLDVGAYDWVVGVGDVELGGGSSDLVVKKAGRGKLWLLEGGPSGFAPPVLLARGVRNYDLVG